MIGEIEILKFERVRTRLDEALGRARANYKAFMTDARGLGASDARRRLGAFVELVVADGLWFRDAPELLAKAGFAEQAQLRPGLPGAEGAFLHGDGDTVASIVTSESRPSLSLSFTPAFPVPLRWSLERMFHRALGAKLRPLPAQGPGTRAYVATIGAREMRIEFACRRQGGVRRVFLFARPLACQSAAAAARPAARRIARLASAA